MYNIAIYIAVTLCIQINTIHLIFIICSTYAFIVQQNKFPLLLLLIRLYKMLCYFYGTVNNGLNGN